MKRFLKAPTFLCVVALFTALLLKGGGAEAASMQSYGSHSIDAGVHPIKTLNAVVEVSARDIWAVGDSLSPSTGEQALIEHWDGAAWSIVPSPNPTTTHNTFLNGVTEVAANDVWAVGGSGQTLIEHWNGEQWRIVASPNPAGSRFTLLNGVTEVSANDVWAVGTTNRPLIEHWNGKQWRIVASPNPSTTHGAFLNGVTEVSARNIWAVGEFMNSSGDGLPLIEHWNGEQWRIVPSAD